MREPIPLPIAPCSACPQSDTALSCSIPALLPPPAPAPPLLILLPAPSSLDAKAGLPLRSRPSALVATAYLSALPPVRPFFIPILRCAVTSPSRVKPAFYTRCAHTHLLPTLLHILAALPPSPPIHLLCIGAPSVRSLHTALSLPPCSRASALSAQAALLPVPTLPHTLLRFATLDPAEILLRPERKSAAFAHLSLLASHLTGTPPLASTPTIVPPGPPPTQGD